MRFGHSSRNCRVRRGWSPTSSTAAASVSWRPCALGSKTLHSGVEYVIRVFDHESVMTPGDELDEDFVALERTRVGCVKYFGAVTLAPGNCRQHRAHEPRLPGPGWPLKNENRFGCREISLNEPIDRLAESRVRFVRRPRIGQLFELGARQSQLTPRDAPSDRARLFPQAPIAHDTEQPIADGLQRHQAVGPNGERHGAVIGFAAPPCAHKHTGTIKQQRPLSQTMGGKTRVLS